MKLALMAGTAAFALTASIGLVSPAQAANEAAAATDNHAEDNLLLKEWTGPYGGVPPWDKVEVSMFGPAYEKAIEAYLAETDAIANNPEAPTFENTVVAMERTGELFSRVSPIFGVHANNLSTPEVREVSKEWSPKISAAFDKVSLNDKLFQRYKTLYDKRETLGLDAAQMRLLERDYEDELTARQMLDAKIEKAASELTETIGEDELTAIASLDDEPDTDAGKIVGFEDDTSTAMRLTNLSELDLATTLDAQNDDNGNDRDVAASGEDEDKTVEMPQDRGGARAR